MQRIGIVGAGGMGSSHGSCYVQMPDAELVAVADIRPDAARKLVDRCGGESFASVQEMLEKAHVDVVDVCTPTPFHLECIAAGAKAGKHVISEKPLARTMDECCRAIEVCEKAGVRLFVAHVVRFFPEFEQARSLVKSGAVGKPVTVRTTRGGGYPMGTDDWYGNIDWSGGVALDLVVHDFDWLLWTFGPAERVFAKGLAYSGRKHMDYALVTIRFKSGLIAHVEGTWCKPSGFQVKVEIAGDAGLIDFTNKETIPLIVEKKTSEVSGGGVPVPESPLTVSPYYRELAHFVECLETGSEPEITPRDAVNAVEIGLAALESMKTGKPVGL